MIENVLAARYAKALAEIAGDKNLIDRINTELILLADILSAGSGAISVPELTHILGMPRISLKEKIRITDIMLEKLDFTEDIGNLLNVLITKNRISLISKISDHYAKLTAELKGVASVNVESAHELSESERKGLKASLANALGKDVELNVKTRQELIGGLKVKINDTLIDKSVSGNLERLKTILS